ncbi:unnamed protein product [Bursaphelenchus xylophilus]|uniref:(pine wood nematode) hypothetical protein n=1 Tax=Bursaphelenchus xylophilus TaxID=6326 RepID=A0A7I8XMC1_BURXY|nr:unnamed protein product [Bursaphelenchus xylophilus]CAG9086716.1 unnamed protein product [Bursaphelenchus xylophilus]
MKNDFYYQEIMKFVHFLNSHAKELVILPRVHVQFPDKFLYFSIQRQIFTNRDFTTAVVDRKIIDDNLPNLQRRLSYVDCSKCMFVDWRNAVCDWERCYAVNERTNNIIFYDYTHVNVLGSLFYGKLVRNMYDEYLETGERHNEDNYKRRRLPFSRF